VSYHYLFVSVIKKALSNSSEEKYQELYYYGNKKNKKSKNFTFSVYLKEFKIVENNFIVNDEIKCIISSPDKELMLYIFNGLLALKNFKYKDYELVLQRVNLIKEQLPTEKEVLFKTLSPIAMKNKEGDFIAPNDLEYNLALNYISNEILLNFRGSGLKEPLVFVPLEMKKQVVKQQHHQFDSLKESILYINAYRGTFKLCGHTEDLKILTQAGIGFRRNQGFGNVQVWQG